MEDKITLDREAFRTLASKTRIDILKSLDRRRKTLSELSKEFGMSVSTIKEHLQNLSKADLIVQKDDGHKWKYYELTRNGKNILHPGRTQVWIILSLSVFAMLATGYDFLQRTTVTYAGKLMEGAGDVMRAPEAAPIAQAPIEIPYIHILGLIVFGIIFGVSLGYIIAIKRKTKLLL